MKKVFLFLAAGVVVVLVTGAVLFKPVIRPWYLRWGASDTEVQLALPGDELLQGEGAIQATRAITIHTPASQIWPWIAQIGQGRGGLYSYELLENLVGCKIKNLNYIDPALQDVKVGDVIKIGPQKGLPYYKVMLVEAGRTFVMRSVSPDTGEMGETWGFYLVEKQPGVTRLVIRHRYTPNTDPTSRVVDSIFEPISFVMERAMLFGIRERAEQMTVTAGAAE